MQKIQGNALASQNRAGGAAKIDDCFAGGDFGTILSNHLDLNCRIDPVKHFRGSFGSGNNRFFTRDNLSRRLAPLPAQRTRS